MPRERLEILRDQPVLAESSGFSALARLATASPRRCVELVAAQLPRELVEHRIDHAGLVAVDEGMGDVDIFRHHDARRHVGACDRARRRRRAGPRAARVSMRLSGQPFGSASSIIGSSLRCSSTTPRTMSRKERGFGRQVFVALDLAAEPVAFEFGQDVVQRRCRRYPSGRAPARRQAARRRGGWRWRSSVGAAALAMAATSWRAARLSRDQRERRARGVAALVLLG